MDAGHGSDNMPAREAVAVDGMGDLIVPSTICIVIPPSPDIPMENKISSTQAPVTPMGHAIPTARVRLTCCEPLTTQMH